MECIVHKFDLAMVGEDIMLAEEIDLIINPGSAIPTFFVDLVFVPVIRNNYGVDILHRESRVRPQDKGCCHTVWDKVRDRSLLKQNFGFRTL